MASAAGALSASVLLSRLAVHSTRAATTKASPTRHTHSARSRLMTEDFLEFLQLLFPQTQLTYQRTIQYYTMNDASPLARVSAAYSSYRALIVLPTGLNFRGERYCPRTYPYFEALGELHVSLTLGFAGEYKAAIQHLRLFLELVTLGTYMVQPISESWVQNWLKGEQKTPGMGELLRELHKSHWYPELSRHLHLDFQKTVYGVYDRLSAYVHTRGYAAVAAAIRGTNIASFNADAFEEWSDLLFKVASAAVLILSGRFPQILQRIPFFEKCGFAGAPRGGFLEPFEVDNIEGVLTPELLIGLQAFSDRYHSDVLQVSWERFDSTPDLTLVELQESFAAYWEWLKELDKGYVPGKTWDLTCLSAPRFDDEAPQEKITPQQYVMRATSVVRQINAGDDAILGQAYARNLFATREDQKNVGSK